MEWVRLYDQEWWLVVLTYTLEDTVDYPSSEHWVETIDLSHYNIQAEVNIPVG